jgi:anti-anti-sigma factor
MNLEAANEKHEVTVPLDGEITIQRASELKDLIWAHLQNSKVINFDTSKITAIDAAGLQLLCSVHRTAQTRGGDAHILQPMPANLAQTIKDSGFKRPRACALDIKHSCLWTQGEQQ